MIKKVSWIVCSGLLIIVIAGAVYFALSVLNEPAARPVLTGFPSAAREIERVFAGTVVREEYAYLCGDVHIVYLGRAPREMMGLDRAALEQKYPAREGWTVEMDRGTLILRKQCQEFCPEHKNYRHLGISEGYLAIFEGPLGNNRKLLRVEKAIPVEKLSPEYQIKLAQAMDFERQLPEIQALLRKELEFSSETALQAGLENLDEHLHEKPAVTPEKSGNAPGFFVAGKFFVCPEQEAPEPLWKIYNIRRQW